MPEYDKDLDREITKIEYNILNLPDKVTFANENIIVNLYDASGKKLSSGYLTKTGNNLDPRIVDPRIAEDAMAEFETATATGIGRPFSEATHLSGLILGNPLTVSVSAMPEEPEKTTTGTSPSTPSSAPSLPPGTTTNPGIGGSFIKTYY